MSSQVDSSHFRPNNSHNSALSLTIFYLFSWPHDKTPYLMVFGGNNSLNTMNDILLNKNGNSEGMLVPGFVPFFEQKNPRTFKETFPILQGLHSVQKRALSLCIF